MEKNYPIKIVQGNYFAIALPLSKIVWIDDAKIEQPLFPKQGDLIIVNLIGPTRKYDMRKVSIDGNVVHYECNEYLEIGTYAIELRLILADGKKYRSYQRNRITIVATDDESGNKNNYEISGAVLLYAKGDKGDQGDRGPTGPRGPVGPTGPRGFRGEDGQDGLSAYEIAVEQGFVGTEEEWLLSLKGDKGDKGTADYNELENVPTFKTINGETIIGEGDIIIENSSVSITIDDALSSESENPVQNKIITAELNNKADTGDLTTHTNDTDIHVTAEDKATWSSKQDAGDYVTGTELETALTDKQDKLVSGTNIKTINNIPILGDGNISISGGEGADGVGIQSIEQTNNTESGAANIITIHLTNGTDETVTIYNGAQGAQGATGPQGATGATGPTGADGKSAYEVAVENGFVGDETAWLASLKGEQGIQGPQGPTGPQGPAGTTDYNNLSNKPTIDQTPTSGNTSHLVSSDGVYQYVDSICGAILTRLQGI